MTYRGSPHPTARWLGLGHHEAIEIHGSYPRGLCGLQVHSWASTHEEDHTARLEKAINISMKTKMGTYRTASNTNDCLLACLLISAPRMAQVCECKVSTWRDSVEVGVSDQWHWVLPG